MTLSVETCLETADSLVTSLVTAPLGNQFCCYARCYSALLRHMKTSVLLLTLLLSTVCKHLLSMDTALGYLRLGYRHCIRRGLAK